MLFDGQIVLTGRQFEFFKIFPKNVCFRDTPVHVKRIYFSASYKGLFKRRVLQLVFLTTVARDLIKPVEVFFYTAMSLGGEDYVSRSR